MNYIALIKDRAVAIKKQKTGIKYIKNTFWLMFEKVFTLAVAFVIGIYMARYLGPKDFGIFNYGRSIAIFFTTFAALNIDQILVKRLLENKDKEHLFLGTYFGLRLLAALLSILVIVFLFVFRVIQDYDLFLIILFFTCSSVFSSFEVIKSYYQSKIASQKIAMAAIIQVLVPSLVRVYLIVNKYPVTYFAFTTIIESFCYAAGLIYFYQRNQLILKWQYSLDIAKKTLAESWPMVISALMIIAYMRIDQVMIKWLLDVENVGFYSAAVRLSEIWFFIGVVICNSLFPSLVQTRLNNPALYKSRFQSLLTLMVVIAFVIIIPISFFSSTIITFLYGTEFYPAGTVLAIHAWGLLFIFLGQVGDQWLLNENLQKLSLYRTLTGLVVNVILNLFLIPAYGITGAAIATLFSQMFASYISNSFDKKSKALFVAQTKSLFFIHLVSLLISRKNKHKHEYQ